MPTESKNNTFDLSTIQRFVFYVMLIVTPVFFIPLPWDITERGKSLLFLVFAILLIFLEFVKWIWNGKITIVKSSLDIPFGLILLSSLLSTFLARDGWTAIWGNDGSLANGFLIAIGLISIFFFSRSFLYSKQTLMKSLEMFLIGITVTTFLSFLSVLGVKVVSSISWYKSIFAPGLPLTYSNSSLFVISAVAILISVFLLASYISEKRYSKIWLVILTTILNGIALTIASMGIGVSLIILFALTILLLSVILFLKVERENRYMPIVVGIFGLVLVLVSVLLQSSSARESLFGKEFQILMPVSLGNDISWNISTSAISSNLFTGIFGLGNDSFSQAYLYFKPNNSDTIALGTSSFAYASNEIFTLLSNNGLLGLGIWIFLGISVIKVLTKDIREYNKGVGVEYLILDSVALFLLLSSLLIPFPFLLKFTFYLIVLFVIIVHNYMRRNKDDLMVIRFWAMDSGNNSKNMSGVNWVFTGLIGLLSAFLVIQIFSLLVSTTLVLKAEAYAVEETKGYENGEDITNEQRQELLKNLLSSYDKALSYDKQSPVLNRRLGLMSLEMVNSLSTDYQVEGISDEDKAAILKQVGNWKNVSIDFSREAVNTSPYTYANWSSRASVYLGLVGVGLQDYSEDTLNALDRSIGLNPYDYDSYYKKARVYVLSKDYEKALTSLNTVLSINNQHIPSYILAAQVSQELKDMTSYKAYLETAKKVLEAYDEQESDTYKSIVKALEQTGTTQETTTPEQPDEQVKPTTSQK